MGHHWPVFPAEQRETYWGLSSSEVYDELRRRIQELEAEKERERGEFEKQLVEKERVLDRAYRSIAQEHLRVHRRDERISMLDEVHTEPDALFSELTTSTLELRGTASGQKAALEETEAQVQALRGTLHAAEENLKKSESTIYSFQERKKAADKETHDLKELNLILQATEHDLRERLDKQDLKVIGCDVTIARLQNSIKNLQLQVETQDSDLTNRKSTIRHLQKEKKSLENQLTAQDLKLTEQDTSLRRLEMANHSLETRLSTKISELQDRDKKTRGLKEGDRGLRNQLIAETLKVQHRDNTIMDLEKQNQDFEELFQQMRYMEEKTEVANKLELAAKDEELTKLYAENEDRRAEGQELKDTIAGVIAENGKLKALLDPKGSTLMEAARGALALANKVAGAAV